MPKIRLERDVDEVTFQRLQKQQNVKGWKVKGGKAKRSSAKKKRRSASSNGMPNFDFSNDWDFSNPIGGSKRKGKKSGMPDFNFNNNWDFAPKWNF